MECGRSKISMIPTIPKESLDTNVATNDLMMPCCTLITWANVALSCFHLRFVI